LHRLHSQSPVGRPERVEFASCSPQIFGAFLPGNDASTLIPELQSFYARFYAWITSLFYLTSCAMA
jgi:hypothetical protein